MGILGFPNPEDCCSSAVQSASAVTSSLPPPAVSCPAILTRSLRMQVLDGVVQIAGWGCHSKEHECQQDLGWALTGLCLL